MNSRGACALDPIVAVESSRLSSTSEGTLAPPAWLPLAAVTIVIVISALRVIGVRAKHGVKACGFGRHPEIQRVAERNWRLAVAATIAITVVAWLRPEWEIAAGRPIWTDTVAVKWAASVVFAASAFLIAVAQMQMGASWRVGVPSEGPGDLVAHGLFRWSRNPIFVGMIGVLAGVVLWSPHIGSAAVLAATRTLVTIQARIKEEALREKHGEDYERYAREVPRWFGVRR